MDTQKNNVALAYPYHEGKLCSKFGRISPSGLRGDSGWTNRGVNNIPIAFLKKRGDNKYLSL